MIEQVTNSPLGSAPAEQPNLSVVSAGGGTLSLETNDTLRLDVYTLLAGLGGGAAAIRINAIVRTWRGNQYEYIPYQRDIILAAVNGSINRVEIALTRGELVSVMVQILTGATVQYGDCFIRLSVIRGQTSDALRFPVAVLIQDYVTSLGYTSWPGGNIISAPDKPGSLVTIDLTPAAGAEISTLVPDNSLWLVKQADLNFTAAAGGAARQPNLYFNDPAGNTVRSYETVDAVAALASLTIFLQPGSQVGTDPITPALIKTGSLFSNEINSAAGLRARIDFAPFLIRAGWRIFTNTVNIAAGDQWSCQLSIERWTFPNVNTP